MSKQGMVIDCYWVRSERVRNVYWKCATLLLNFTSVCVCVFYLYGDGTNNAGSEGMNPSARGAQLSKLTEVWDNIVVVTD
jgi:hypothetical protein